MALALQSQNAIGEPRWYQLECPDSVRSTSLRKSSQPPTSALDVYLSANNTELQQQVSNLLSGILDRLSIYFNCSNAGTPKWHPSRLHDFGQERQNSIATHAAQRGSPLYRSPDDTLSSDHYISNTLGAQEINQPSSNSTTTAKRGATNVEKARASMVPTRLGRKRTLQSDNGESEEEGNGTPTRSAPPSKELEGTQSLRFACPFFKRNPPRYMHFNSCPGPGWNDVHRLKEHLYRNHMQPSQCLRCGAVFEIHVDLQNHLRAAVACDIQPFEPVDGVTPEQQIRLRSRKKPLKPKSEAEKWVEVYQTLFPEDDPSDTPSPYYETTVRSKGDVFRQLDEKLPGALYDALTLRAGPLNIAPHEMAAVVRQTVRKVLELEGDMPQNSDAFLSSIPNDSESGSTSIPGNDRLRMKDFQDLDLDFLFQPPSAQQPLDLFETWLSCSDTPPNLLNNLPPTVTTSSRERDNPRSPFVSSSTSTKKNNFSVHEI